MSYRAQSLGSDASEPFMWEPLGAWPATTGATASFEGTSRDADQQVRLAAIERDAFAVGYEQGERAGVAAAGARTDDMLQRLTRTIEELTALRGEIIRRSERQTVQLVLAISERIVLREVSLDRGLLVAMARSALDRLGEYGSATIRLHPDDCKAITAATAVATEGSPLRVVADGSVSRGGCLVQSDFGFMDVTPDAQFRELARALLLDADASPGDPDLAGIAAT